MIYDGTAADGVLHAGNWVWALIIGCPDRCMDLSVWRIWGKVNTVAMTALFILSPVLFKVIFWKRKCGTDRGWRKSTFGAAVELVQQCRYPGCRSSVIIREPKNRLRQRFVSVVVWWSVFLCIWSVWEQLFLLENMTLRTGVKDRICVVGLLIIVFSTVTTTFWMRILQVFPVFLFLRR